MLFLSYSEQQHFQSLLFYFVEPVWQVWPPVWSSVAAAHSLQGRMCCAFRDAASFLGSDHWLLELPLLFYHLDPACPFSSPQQDTFIHTPATHWIFSLFQTIFCKSRIDYVWNTQLLSSFIWHHQPGHVQTHLNPCSSLFWCSVWMHLMHVGV